MPLPIEHPRQGRRRFGLAAETATGSSDAWPTDEPTSKTHMSPEDFATPLPCLLACSCTSALCATWLRTQCSTPTVPFQKTSVPATVAQTGAEGMVMHSAVDIHSCCMPKQLGASSCLTKLGIQAQEMQLRLSHLHRSVRNPGPQKPSTIAKP